MFIEGSGNCLVSAAVVSCAAVVCGPEAAVSWQASLSETAKQLRERTAAESEELAGSGSPGEASIADTVEMVKMEQVRVLLRMSEPMLGGLV